MHFYVRLQHEVTIQNQESWNGAANYRLERSRKVVEGCDSEASVRLIKSDGNQTKEDKPVEDSTLLE
jgi:hypothetical protein